MYDSKHGEQIEGKVCSNFSLEQLRIRVIKAKTMFLSIEISVVKQELFSFTVPCF